MSQLRAIVLSADELRSRVLAALQNSRDSATALAASNASIDPMLAFQNGTFRSTTISLGLSPAIGTKPALAAPTITTGEIGTDGTNNPYVTINYSIDPHEIDGASIVGFRLYRRPIHAEDLAQKVEAYTRADFEKVSTQSTKAGKFSADNKAQHQINKAKLSTIDLNANLHIEQATANQQSPGMVTDLFPVNLPGLGSAQLIARINYNDARNAAKLKRVYSVSAQHIDLSYTDFTVTYGTAYAYSMTSISSTGEESALSTELSMVILNLRPIDPPLSVQINKNSDTIAILSVSVNPKDLIKNVYIYRREQTDLFFHALDVLPNMNNFVSYTDTDIEYMHSYTYRVILENIFGAVSEPVEATFVCTSQHVLSRSRSNNLQLPILLATQDINSDGIKLTVFPNDTRVLYYRLERRNITAGESVFAMPSNNMQEFWGSNQFFVKPTTILVTGSSKPNVFNTTNAHQTQQRSIIASLKQLITGRIASGSLPARSTYVNFGDHIEFIDNIVAPNNYYEYRIIGYDVFGNATGCGFVSFSAMGKNPLRTPINFTAEILRESPFRILLRWEDDNAVASAERNEQAQQTYLQMALQQAKLSKEQQNDIQDIVANQDLKKIDIANVLAPYNIKQAQITAIQQEWNALQNGSNARRYHVQRRLYGAATYQSFPLTVNNFIVDEVATADAILFSTGSAIEPHATGSILPLTGTVRARPFGMPDFLIDQQAYEYRIAAMTLDGGMSDFSPPVKVVASAQISEPVGLNAIILNPNVSPTVVKLSWNNNPLKNVPDHWRIERMANSTADTFRLIGNAYLLNEYFDRTAQSGMQYIYRIRSVGATGDESAVQTFTMTT